jgi:hypothetical protein
MKSAPLVVFRVLALLGAALVFVLPAIKSKDTGVSQSPTALTAREFASRSAQLKLAMKKADVAKIMGEPNVKTARKWAYTGTGILHFSAEGTLIEVVSARK